MVFCKKHAYGNGGNQLKYKKLVSAGCSFIHGSELGDENPYSHKTYPALLSKHLNLQYDCVAYPGASNQGIVKQIFDYDISEDCLFLIQWTFPWRMGVDLSYLYTNEKKQKQTWFDLAPNHWQLQGKFDGQVDEQLDLESCSNNLKMLGVDQLNEQVYKHLGNDRHLNFYTRLCVLAIQQYLHANHCKFVFTAGVNSVAKLPYVVSFENLGFKEWCEKKKFKLGPYKHPLDEAHHSAFEYLCNILNI